MEWLADYEYLGLFLGSFLAATIIPFSSDILFIAILIAGDDPVISVIVATLGNWLGGLTSYGLGWIGKWEWIEKWLKVGKEKLEKQRDKISKYGSLLALLTWLPGVGDVIAVGLGFYRISFCKSALFMLIGKGARFVLWALIHYWMSPLF